jgi:RNAse (barnase) inhibitor barstar
MSGGFEGDQPPARRRWAWEHSVAPQWLLLGDVGFERFYDDDTPLALCAEIDGLFVDLPARPREMFTLVGCTPGGTLADLVDRLPAEAFGTERAWLGDMSLTAPPPPPDTPPSWCGVDLSDLVLLDRRPSTTLAGTVDIDLDGFVYLFDRTDAVDRPGDVTEFVLLGRDEAHYGICRDVAGVFRPQGPPPVPQVRLLGCRPEPALQGALDAAGQSSPRRRRIRAEVYAVAIDGSGRRIIDAVVSGTVEAAHPSRFGAGLLDVTVHSDPREPLPTGILTILQHWLEGRPAQPNLWAPYDRELRHRWAGMALANRPWPDVPDRPAGSSYDLDGQFVTDIEGFYCAIGEAINGPGGYFGWNLDALHDCLRGGFGTRRPFRLVWHHSTVARQHLTAGYDRHRPGPTTTFDHLLDILTAHHVDTDLR